MSSSAKVRMVKGPATVSVDGKCHLLGIDVSGHIVKVRKGKALPFEPIGRCRLRARIGRGGRMWLADSKQAGTSLWRDIARQVCDLAADKKVITMLVGGTDTGKSTLSAYLANVALGFGLRPCVIDGDIGQGDLGPPASIGAAVLSKQVTDLRDVGATLFGFVGNTSPVGFEILIARKLRSVLEMVRPLGDLCIVNTDGYVKNGGVGYKLMIAKELQPDVILCLGECSQFVEPFADGPWRVLIARPSSEETKSTNERKSGRLDQFLRHVGNMSRVIALTGLKFVYMDEIFSTPELSQPPILQLEPKNLKRMFVGLGSENKVVGFGIIKRINKSNMIVQTDVGFFDSIHLSNIRLTGNRPVEIRISRMPGP